MGPWRSTASGNLPVALTRFCGRDAELEEIAVLLAGHRLVTITGAGGVGKTQTALRAATALSDQVGAAVCFVDLARIGDSSLVATAVASALGVQEVPNHPLRDTLIAFLKNKTVLLLLDNCEHVVAEAATIADSLLHGCSNLRILATSREPLKMAGERTYRLPSLDENNAVSLFADRAQAADARFDLAGANRPIVSEICRRLSSIPLAIELAAARVTVLPVKALAKARDDRLQVLSEGKRTSAPRQQTMRATIDWSYDLLTKAYDPSLLFSTGGPLNQGSFQVALLNYQNGIEPDPSDFVSCSQRAPNGFNWARYSREDIDRAVLQGASVYDRADRRRIYRFIQRRLLEDIPYDFLWQSSEIDVIPSALRGYEPSAISPYSSVAHWRLQE